MIEITSAEYLEYIKEHNNVIIEDTKLEIGKKYEIKQYQPIDFKPEISTVWSFPERENGLHIIHKQNIEETGHPRFREISF